MVRFHIRDELYESGRIDVAKLRPPDRLAGNYTKVESFPVKRTFWVEPIRLASARAESGPLWSFTGSRIKPPSHALLTRLMVGANRRALPGCRGDRWCAYEIAGYPANGRLERVECLKESG
jgi:hypothetical protein